jgi:hypothetical protein
MKFCGNHFHRSRLYKSMIFCTDKVPSSWAYPLLFLNFSCTSAPQKCTVCTLSLTFPYKYHCCYASYPTCIVSPYWKIYAHLPNLHINNLYLCAIFARLVRQAKFSVQATHPFVYCNFLLRMIQRSELLSQKCVRHTWSNKVVHKYDVSFCQKVVNVYKSAKTCRGTFSSTRMYISTLIH